MMQLPGGVPVVIPTHAIGGGAAAQASHQTMVLVLSSDALSGSIKLMKKPLLKG